MGNSDSKTTGYGYRIVKVAPGSPAQKAGLVEFLDYIIDISSPGDQTPFTGNYGEFFKIVQNSEDKEATMKVYNILYRRTRIVTIVPSKKWENADSLLGALVRYEEYSTAHERVLRIAEVHPNSPALAAGLEANTDYILGSPQYLYTDLNELANFIEMTQEKETIKSLELFVFSTQTNSVRSTLIIPNKDWGGPGHLGCEFALGILNQLPHFEETIPVSHFGDNRGNLANEQIDRLDADDSPMYNETPNTLEKNLIQDKTLEEQVNKSDENLPHSLAHQQEKVPEFKLRPPTSSEVEQTKLAREASNGQKTGLDISQELTQQRMKQLHLGHQYKIPPKVVPKPVIRPGKSSANPFHQPEHSASSHNGSLSMTSPVASQELSTHERSPTNDTHNVQPAKQEIQNAAEVKQISVEPESQSNAQPSAQSDAQSHPQPHLQTQEQPHRQNQEEEKLVMSPIQPEIEQQDNIKQEKEQPLEEAQTISANINGHQVSPKLATNKIAQSPTHEKVLKSAEKKEEIKIESPKRSPQPVKAQEKQTCKTTIEYNFFSKKLSGEYKIKSSNLFSLDEFLEANSKKQ